MRYWEDFHAGDEAVHGSHEMTADEIVAFAREFDPQPFHTDPEAAADGPFGGLIASGWHTAAIYMGLFVRNVLLDSASMGSPGVEELRWLVPVRPGDVLTGRSRDRRDVAVRARSGPRHGDRRARARQPARRGRAADARPRAHRPQACGASIVGGCACPPAARLPELPRPLRRAGADPLDRRERRLSLVLLELRPARELPRHRHRLPALEEPLQAVPVRAGRARGARPLRAPLPRRDQSHRQSAHLLRLAHEDRAADLGDAARGLRRHGGDHGSHRRGDGARVRAVRAARGVPARHRRLDPRHLRLLAAVAARAAAARLGRRRGRALPRPAAAAARRSAGGRRARVVRLRARARVAADVGQPGGDELVAVLQDRGRAPAPDSTTSRSTASRTRRSPPSPTAGRRSRSISRRTSGSATGRSATSSSSGPAPAPTSRSRSRTARLTSTPSRSTRGCTRWASSFSRTTRIRIRVSAFTSRRPRVSSSRRTRSSTSSSSRSPTR